MFQLLPLLLVFTLVILISYVSVCFADPTPSPTPCSEMMMQTDVTDAMVGWTTDSNWEIHPEKVFAPDQYGILYTETGVWDYFNEPTYGKLRIYFMESAWDGSPSVNIPDNYYISVYADNEWMNIWFCELTATGTEAEYELYVGIDGSTYWDVGGCELAKAAKTPTPSPTPVGYKTPTPTPCNAWVMYSAITDMTIGVPIWGATEGHDINIISSNEEAWWVIDGTNAFAQGEPATGCQTMWFYFYSYGEGDSLIPEGYYLTVDYVDCDNSAQNLTAWFTAFTLGNEGDVNWYVGTDGSTYYDFNLCELAKAAITPTPSPTVTPTPSPSPVGYINRSSLSMADDCWQDGWGAAYPCYPDTTYFRLRLYPSLWPEEQDSIGIRIPNIPFDGSDVVISSYLHLYINEYSSGGNSMLYGELRDAPDFSTESNIYLRYSNYRTQNWESVNWNTNTGWVTSPSLNDILTEIFADANWSKDSDLGFVVYPEQIGVDAWTKFSSAVSYIEITAYNTPTPTPTPVTTATPTPTPSPTPTATPTATPTPTPTPRAQSGMLRNYW